jgi:hypothetical protein
MEHDGYATRIFWNPQMLSDIHRLFPTTLNEELADYLGISQRTLVRKARELGLHKNPTWLKQIWEERRRMAQLASMVKGYPGSFREGHTIGIEHRFKPKNKHTDEQY